MGWLLWRKHREMVPVRMVGEIAVLRPHLRESHVEAGTERLLAVAEQLVASGTRRLIIDLGDTWGCGDDLVSALYTLHRRCQLPAGWLVVCRANKDYRWFLPRFPFVKMYGTEAEAIGSFGPTPSDTGDS